MNLPHPFLRDGQIGAPDAQEVRPNGQRSVPEVGVLKTEPIRDHLPGDWFVDLRHDGLNRNLGIGDISVVRQSTLPLHCRSEGLDDGPRVEPAVAVGQEATQLTPERAQEVSRLRRSWVKRVLRLWARSSRPQGAAVSCRVSINLSGRSLLWDICASAFL